MENPEFLRQDGSEPRDWETHSAIGYQIFHKNLYEIGNEIGPQDVS